MARFACNGSSCQAAPPRTLQAFLRGTPVAARHSPGVSDTPQSAATQAWALLLEYDGTGFVGWQRQASR